MKGLIELSSSKIYMAIYKRELQGGQNFFEKIRTKIRTFSEEIRTIFEKKIHTIRTFFKIRTISTIFEKKSLQSVHLRKIKPFLKILFNTVSPPHSPPPLSPPIS